MSRVDQVILQAIDKIWTECTCTQFVFHRTRNQNRWFWLLDFQGSWEEYFLVWDRSVWAGLCLASSVHWGVAGQRPVPRLYLIHGTDSAWSVRTNLHSAIQRRGKDVDDVWKCPLSEAGDGHRFCRAWCWASQFSAWFRVYVRKCIPDQELIPPSYFGWSKLFCFSRPSQQRPPGFSSSGIWQLDRRCLDRGHLELNSDFCDKG